MNQDAVKEIEVIRPELNLEKWSIWQPAKSKNQPRERLLRREVTLLNGGKILAEVEIGFTNRGMLTTEDQKTYYALIQHWEEKGRSTQQTFFSLRRLAKILKKKWGTNVIESLSSSLLRLRFTPFIWRNSFYDKSTSETREILDTFTILSDLKIVRRKKDGVRSQEVGYFSFNDFILENLLRNHTKPLFVEVLLSFKSEIAQLLYTYLDLIMANRDSYERKTKELFEDLGLEGKTYKNPSDRKRVIEKALRELRGVRLTTGILSTALLRRTQDGEDDKVVFKKTPQIPVSPDRGLPKEQTFIPEEGEQELLVLLQDRHVKARSALKIVEAYPAERIKEKVEILDWLLQNSREKIQNPPGFLKRMIEEDWPAPEGCVSEAERQQQEAERHRREEELRRQEEARCTAEIATGRVRQQRREASPWKDLWEQITDHLAQQMPRQSFHTWIQPLFLAELRENAIVLECPSRFIKEWLEQEASYRSVIEEATRTVCGGVRQVVFAYAGEKGPS
jgi:hypothetical protein